MKLLTWTSILIFVLILVGMPVNALELDVEDAMSQFASEVRLLDEELELLRNPFADYRPEEPEPDQETASSAESDDNGAENEEELEEEEPENNEPPGFSINGSAQSGGRVVLIIENGEAPKLLLGGQSHDGYQFTGFENGEATFTREGQEFNLQVGGGA